MDISENICKFIPAGKSFDNIQILNFVLETDDIFKGDFKMNAYFTVNLVLSGTGVLYKNNNKYELKENTLFFTFPSERYSITPNENLKYIYLSFMGLRANSINNKLNIRTTNSVFYDYDEIKDTVLYFFEITQNTNLVTISESTLLYIYGILEKNILCTENDNSGNETINRIIKYINENYCNPNINLDTISDSLSYNKNYISNIFKKKLGVSVSNYITAQRIKNARSLMDNNITSVKDISFQCGFADPLYFSKIFKKITGISPKDYILSKK